MDMVSESGAITDVNEIAAALGLTPEVIKAEDEAIAATSLEDLLEAVDQTEEMIVGEEVDPDILSPAMESIIGIANEIQRAGAISRADAITLRQMTASLEGFQDTFLALPVNSFTEMPSKVNFDSSMESVLGNVGRKIIEAIKKIIKWIREKARAIWQVISGNRAKAKKLEVAAAKVTAELKKVEEPKPAPVYQPDLYINENLQRLFNNLEDVRSFSTGVSVMYDAMFDVCNQNLINTSNYTTGIDVSVTGKFKKGVMLIGKSLRNVDLSDMVRGDKKSEVLMTVFNCLREIGNSVNSRANDKVNISGMNPPRYVEKLLDNARIGGLTNMDRIVRNRDFIAKKVEEARTFAEKQITVTHGQQDDFAYGYDTVYCAQYITSIVDLCDKLHGFYLSQYAELAKVGFNIAVTNKEAQA